MALHRMHIDPPLTPGLCTIAGEEAHHAARVKRLEVGERVEVLDGRGGIGKGKVSRISKSRDGWQIEVDITEALTAPRPAPHLEVCTAIPKGAHLGDMIDGLAQVGAALWRPLETRRSVREHWRPERLERIAAEASKQSGRAWSMEIGDSTDFRDVLKDTDLILADVSGERFEGALPRARLLIGPEGGWTDDELSAARQARVRVCRFGVHTMRIETAAVIAAGIIMNSR